MIHVCTWLWGDKFNVADVAKLAAGVRRNLKQPHRILCMVDRMDRETIEGVGYRQILDHDLIAVKGCYARLRLFDPHWQFMREIPPGERIVNIDLDTVITGELDLLFDRPEPFVIMQKGNASNPCPMNGALMMIRAGAHPEVWTDFSVEAASKVPFFEFPDDQGWIWHKAPDAAGWKCGIESGVFVFRKPGWPSFDRKMKTGGDELPKGARLVTFSGGRSPEKYKHLDWIRENWRE